MRKSVCIVIALLMAVLLIPWGADETNAAPGDDVKVNLKVKFEDAGTGHLEFYMGSGSPEDLNEIQEIPEAPTNYNDKNIKRLVSALGKEGRDTPSVFRTLINHSSPVELFDVGLSMRDEADYFCLSLICEFDFTNAKKDPEYGYLKFMYDYENSFKIGGGFDAITDRTDREGEMMKVKIEVRIELDPDLSMTSTSVIVGHRRTIDSESLHDSTDAMRFTKDSNRLKIFENELLSPFSIFILWLSILMIGYGYLVFLWWRKRYMNIGLVIPMITIVFSIFLIISFFLPGLSFYSMGGFSLWMYCGIFLLLLGLCTIAVPGGEIEGYEEAKKSNHFKMPKVIYIDRKVFINRGRSDQEEESDPYEVLEVDPDSSFDEIEKAFRMKIKEYHPDKYMNSPKRIRSFTIKETRRLNKAYETLKKKHGK